MIAPGRRGTRPLVLLLVLTAALANSCGGGPEPTGTPSPVELGAHWTATAERPYSFDYPEGWVTEAEGGDVGLLAPTPSGSDTRAIVMVLEPGAPWAGGQGPSVGDCTSGSASVDGYTGNRYSCTDDQGNRLEFYRVNASGTDVTVWFAAAAETFDEDLVAAVMASFQIDEDLLP